jgi:histidyl-tRNA synthetase
MNKKPIKKMTKVKPAAKVKTPVKTKEEILSKNGASLAGKLAVPAPLPKKGASEIQTLRGFKDILPAESHITEHIEDLGRSFARAHGFERIETPILEATSLFVRGVGKQTDIVEKEMYTFIDKGEESVTMRPEATASVARAYVNHGMLNQPQPVKLWYCGPFFRYERPQAGRFREFRQLGFEVLGESHPIVDAELISVGFNMIKALGLEVSVQINSIGTKESRAAYIEKLVEYYRSHRSKICEDDKRRLTRNPLRVLDCKNPECQPIKEGAPQILDSLDEESKSHFMRVLEYLDDAGVTYALNPFLVRGFDYYTRTVFEYYAAGDDDAAQSALGGGGRYDGLVEMVGGRPTPAAGMALGVERLVSRMRARGLDKEIDGRPDVFVAQLGEAARKKTLGLVEELRRAGIAASSNLAKDGLKQQLEMANRNGARFTVIMGQKEILDGTIIIRDMDSGIQEICDFKKAAAELKRKLSVPALPRTSAPAPANNEDATVSGEEEVDIGFKIEEPEEPAEPVDKDKEEE